MNMIRQNYRENTLRTTAKLVIVGTLMVLAGCAQSAPKVSEEELRQAMTQAVASDPNLAQFEQKVKAAFAEPARQSSMRRAMTTNKEERPINWQTRFTYEGQLRPGPYSVDPHIWVYTKEFAKRFGMPSEWIDPDIKGVEAAAWRKTKTGYVTCGWGGKKEVCKDEDAAVLELYIDTQKVKLPWASWTDEFAHLSTRLWETSTRFLTTQRCERRRAPTPNPLLRRPDPREDCLYNTYRTPFADMQSGAEIHLYEKGMSYGGQGNGKGIEAYDKNAYPDLAWVQIGYTRPVGLFNPPQAAVITLEIREAPLGKTLRQYHEIVLPMSFDSRIKTVLDASRDAEREFYKKSLEMK